MKRPVDLPIDLSLYRSIWRVRRRRDRLDALLRRSADGWELAFLHNMRPLISRNFPTERAARAEAKHHLQELERAGWNQHW